MKASIGPALVLLVLLSACGRDSSEQEIVFTSAESMAEADLWLVTSAGKDPSRLTDEPGVEYMAAWSPDGDRVAYVAGAAYEGATDLFVIDVDGGEPERVTSTPGRCETQPTWAPDGEELVYVSGDCEAGPEGIFAADLAGGAERLLVADGMWPDVGPDGRLLYTAPVPGQPWQVQSLWVSEPDGSDAREVTPSGFDSAFEASWSPDGSRIAFVSAAGDAAAEDPPDWNEEVYVMDADGSDPQRLTTTPGNDHWPPSWSPDGVRLVYTADGVQNSGRIATVDVETLEVTLLTDDDDDEVHDLFAAWRP